jgi:hypothetical protein
MASAVKIVNAAEAAQSGDPEAQRFESSKVRRASDGPETGHRSTTARNALGLIRFSGQIWTD